MRKILLLMLICVLFMNTVSAFEDDFATGLTNWVVGGAGWSSTGGKAVNYISCSGNGCASGGEINYSTTTQYSYFSLEINGTTTDSPNYVDGCCSETRFYFSDTEYLRLNAGRVLDIENAGPYDAYSIAEGTTVKVSIEVVGSNLVINIYDESDNLLNTQTISKGNPAITNISIKTTIGTGAYSATQTNHFDNVVASNSNPDSPGSGTIIFTADKYNLGDIAYIDATLINPDYDTYGYRTIIYNPDGSVNHAHMWAEPTISQYGFSINIENLGTYTVKLQRFTGLYEYTDLASDTAVGQYQNDALMSIYFNDSYYNTGDTVLIQSNISNINNSLYFYEVMVIKPNGNFYNVHNITANESYSLITNVPGEWNAVLTSYPKSDPAMIENQVSDSMITYGTGVGASWVAFNDTYYYKNSWARIDYGISINDFYDSHKMQITNEDGTVVFDRQILAQSGYFDYYFYESGKYTVTIDRNWFVLDWDLTDNEILASDVTEVTNTIEGGYTLGITPTTLNCGQTVYFSADTPDLWNTTSIDIKDVNGTIVKTILGQAGSFKTNQTGQFWAYLNDDGAIQATGYFYVYGTCTGYDQLDPNGNGGIKPKPFPQTDQATSNAELQNNLLYFMGLPIFWGMIIFIGALIVAAVNKAGAAIPYLAPGILLFEAVVGLLDPYSSFIIVGFAIIAVMYFIGNFVANRAGN